MDLNYLFTSFEGRINRKPFWIGILIMIASAIVITLILALFVSIESRAFAIVSFLVQLAFLYPSLALMVKRLHDRDRPDYFAYIMLAPGVLNGLTAALGMTGDPVKPNALDFVLGLAMLAVGIWALVELGCLRGTVGPNRHGPDPLAGQPA